MSLANDDRDGLRRCRDCGEWKSLDQFHTSSRRPTGRGSYCWPCYNLRSKASYRKRMKEQHGREVRESREVPEGHRYCPDCETVKPLAEFPPNRADAKGRGGCCKPCHNANSSAAKQRLYGGNREYHLRHRYGIGEKEFDALLAAQGGVCGICGRPDPRHVDHDHLTGYIRGVLCFPCNGGLGHFRDNVGHLHRAVDYLRATASVVPEHPGVYRVRTPRYGMRPVCQPDRKRASLTTDQASE